MVLHLHSKYLVIIKLEIHRNFTYQAPPPPGSVAAYADHGRLIAPHIQGFIWGEALSRRQRAQFAGGIFSAPGVKIVRVHDFPGALKYMGKPPYRGRSVYRLASGRYI